MCVIFHPLLQEELNLNYLLILNQRQYFPSAIVLMRLSKYCYIITVVMGLIDQIKTQDLINVDKITLIAKLIGVLAQMTSCSFIADLLRCLRLWIHSHCLPDQRCDQAVGHGPQQGLSAGLPAYTAQPP